MRIRSNISKVGLIQQIFLEFFWENQQILDLTYAYVHVCSLRQYHHTNAKKTNPKKNILFTLIAIYTQSMLIHTCMKSRRIRRRRRLRGIQLDIEQRWGWNSRWGNKFENSGKIWIRTRERSWQRDAVFFLPSFPLLSVLIDDRRGFIYFYARVKRIRFMATPIFG